jgi:hypothetical protein
MPRIDSVKDPEVFLESRLYFHNNANFIFSHCTKLLDLLRNVTFHFSSLECMFMLYFVLVRSKVEQASVARNSITSTDANKLERIQRKFVARRFNRFFPQFDCSYDLALETSKLHILQKRWHRLNTLFLAQVYCDSKFCPPVLGTVGLRVPSSYVHCLFL